MKYVVSYRKFERESFTRIFDSILPYLFFSLLHHPQLLPICVIRCHRRSRVKELPQIVLRRGVICCRVRGIRISSKILRFREFIFIKCCIIASLHSSALPEMDYSLDSVVARDSGNARINSVTFCFHSLFASGRHSYLITNTSSKYSLSPHSRAGPSRSSHAYRARI